MEEEAFEYLEQVQVLLRDAFKERVHISLGLKDGEVPLLRGCVAETLFSTPYNPAVSVEEFAQLVIRTIKSNKD